MTETTTESTNLPTTDPADQVTRAPSTCAVTTRRYRTNSPPRPSGAGRHPARTRWLVPAEQVQPAHGDRPLVLRRRDDPRRSYRGRGGQVVPQPLGAHGQLREPFPVYNADGTRNLRSSVANTHVINHAGRTLALVESSLPYGSPTISRPSAAMTSTAKLNDAMTAHPKICPTTGSCTSSATATSFSRMSPITVQTPTGT